MKSEEMITRFWHLNGATNLTVRPPGRFGALMLEDGNVREFVEKPLGDGGWINGGFFVLSPKVLDYIDGDSTSWEGGPLSKLAEEGQVKAFEHGGFWQAMDTLRDKHKLEQLWDAGTPPWRLW